MRRGDVVSVVLSGDYGKPRPALIVQDDAFRALPSVTVLPLTSDLRNSRLLRITVEPSQGNGLKTQSQIMVDKVATITRPKVGRAIGRLDRITMDQVDTALAQFFGLV